MALHMLSREARERIQRILGLYLKRSLAAAAIGIVAALLLDHFHETPPMLQFERAGADAAMRFYAWTQGKRLNYPRRPVVAFTNSTEIGAHINIVGYSDREYSSKARSR
jgi:hypothetical protein